MVVVGHFLTFVLCVTALLLLHSCLPKIGIPTMWMYEYPNSTIADVKKAFENAFTLGH